MASLDIPRTALCLSDAELGAAVMLLTGAQHPLMDAPTTQEAVASLEAAGILEDGRPTGYPARLLAIVTAPKLRIAVESYFAGGPRLDQAWATEREGVLGSVTADGTIELTPVEPSLLPWAIARWVGLGPREHGERRPITVGAEAFGIAGDAVERGDEEAARAALDGLDERVLAVLRERRLSWRATSAWSDARGEHVSSVAVLDAATEGLWLTHHDGDDVHLEPVPPSRVWEAIDGLMPSPEAE
jgi:hypothetical protein